MPVGRPPKIVEPAASIEVATVVEEPKETLPPKSEAQERLEKVEKKLDLLIEYIKAQVYVYKVGGDAFASYPEL